jgi:cobalt/nickel transport system permease protein
MKRLKLLALGFLSFLLILLHNQAAQAMHIMEGFLPWGWAVFWWALALPFWLGGMRTVSRLTRDNPQLKLLLALAGAFAFVLSALKLPSVTGSSSHPTGIGLGTVLFGPGVMVVLGSLVLFFQALLLAHGGLTTLGANTFSMALVGSGVAWLVYQGCRSLHREKLGIFLAAALSNLATYLVTSLQLALAFPAASGGILASFLKFAGIFALTQIPLGISEGLLTLLVWDWLQTYARPELDTLRQLRLSHADK